MVKIGEFDVPEGLYYSENYFWVKIEGGKVRAGLTDYAQKTLKHIVYADIPKSGMEIKQSEVCGSLESIKAVADLMSPLSGKVVEYNENIDTNAGLINEDPYRKGWLFVVEPTNLNAELKNLMDFNKAVEWHKALVTKK